MDRGLFKVNALVSCPGTSVACRSDTVICMPLSLMIDVCWLACISEDGPVVFVASFFYVAAAIRSTSLAEEAACGGSPM